MEKKKAHNNKGGSIASNGYKLIFVGKDHHLADIRGYAYEHRIVAEQKYGRRLLPNEEVHHKDHNKLNNNPDNLEIEKSKKHHRIHHRTSNFNLRLPDEENEIVYCKCRCGEKFMKYDSVGRPREYVSGHNPSNSFCQKFIIDQIKIGNNTTKGLCDKYGTKGNIRGVLTRMVKDELILRVDIGIYKINNG